MRLALAVACIAGLAAAPARAGGLTFTAAAGFETRYLFRGVELSEMSFQPSLMLGYRGFYGGAWANIPLDDNALTPAGEEIDLIAGWGAAIGKSVSIDLGVTYYAYPARVDGLFDVFREDAGGGGANTVEPYVGLAVSGPLSPKLYLYRDFYLDTFTVQGTLAHSFPVAEKTSIDLSGIVGHVFDDDPGLDYPYGHASANLAYAFTDKVSAYAGVRYGGSDLAGGSVTDDAGAGTRKPSGFWFGVGFTAKF